MVQFLIGPTAHNISLNCVRSAHIFIHRLYFIHLYIEVFIDLYGKCLNVSTRVLQRDGASFKDNYIYFLYVFSLRFYCFFFPTDVHRKISTKTGCAYSLILHMCSYILYRIVFTMYGTNLSKIFQKATPVNVFCKNKTIRNIELNSLLVYIPVVFTL